MALKYKNLEIRNTGPQDAALLCRWWNDGTVMAHDGFPNRLNTTPDAVRAALSGDSDDTCRRYILLLNSAPIGEMCDRNLGGHTAEIGIKLCVQEEQEKGYGTLFLKMLISALFAEGYERIVLDTDVKNARARHVYEKLGFRMLRINQDVWVDQLGQPRSSVDYELRRAWFTPLECSR